MNRTCPKCGVEKNLTDFYRDRSTKTGVTSACKQCMRVYQDEYHKTADLITARRKTLYGLDVDAYDRMVEFANGCCEICGTTTDLQVDHDHACCSGAKTCGKCVRGLLCWRCNRAIGMFRDSPVLMVSAAHYVRTASLLQFVEWLDMSQVHAEVTSNGHAV